MIHHIDFAVTDFVTSREFYVQALSPLGLEAVMDRNHEDGRTLTGFGELPDPAFWIRNGKPLQGPLLAPQWTHFMPLHWQRAEQIKVHQVFVLDTRNITTQRIFLILMATILKRSVVYRNKKEIGLTSHKSHLLCRLGPAFRPTAF